MSKLIRGWKQLKSKLISMNYVRCSFLVGDQQEKKNARQRIRRTRYWWLVSSMAIKYQVRMHWSIFSKLSTIFNSMSGNVNECKWGHLERRTGDKVFFFFFCNHLYLVLYLNKNSPIYLWVSCKKEKRKKKSNLNMKYVSTTNICNLDFFFSLIYLRHWYY